LNLYIYHQILLSWTTPTFRNGNFLGSICFC